MMVVPPDGPILSTDQWLVIIGFVVSATMYVVTIRSSNKQVADQLKASNEAMTAQMRAGNEILNSKLELIDGTMENFKEEIKKLNEVLVAQATQGARMTFMEERVLQQGKRIDAVSTAVNRILFKLAMPEPVVVETKMTLHGDE